MSKHRTKKDKQENGILILSLNFDAELVNNGFDIVE